ncbi:hypothetical protein HPP92_001345 [Vanilla planifolia]|uniref:Uncharacterized protein n=1 Tax=Vanilla planifolia TaxID=51239 RepID=A0A835SCI1_VANPL|nr:hypothetical protein HPP92_001345 [Vanilla planifolia]
MGRRRGRRGERGEGAAKYDGAESPLEPHRPMADTEPQRDSVREERSRLGRRPEWNSSQVRERSAGGETALGHPVLAQDAHAMLGGGGAGSGG